MRLFGLLGYPLAQSFSKKYFDEKIRQQGLTDCRFENFSFPTITDVENLLQDPSLQGFAITIPYKQDILKYVDDVNGIPPGLNACNCVRIRNGKLYGFNTDHVGFEKSLFPLLKAWHTKALILGNGGVAAAVMYSLKKAGIDYSLVSRERRSDSDYTYAELTAPVINDHLLIINTTPLGMYPKVDSCPAIPYELLTDRHLAFDMVYNPEKPLFLAKAEASGAAIKNGYEMLVLQAEENWRIWMEE